MKYRLLGRTGLFVSELSLGTMGFGGANPFWKNIGEMDAEAATAQVRMAVDAGINVIDTADYYSNGTSEVLVGEALRRLALPREAIIVATKARLRMGPGPNQVGLSRARIVEAAEQSLKRLGLDHIDLYQLHGVDALTPIDETLEGLELLVRAGKVRYVGVCNFPAWRLMQGLAAGAERRLPRFQSAQMYYSLAGRDVETEVVPLCLDQGVGLMAWSPLAGGYLSGKYAEGHNAGRRLAFDFPPVPADIGDAALGALRTVATRHGVSLARVALAWLLRKPAVTTVIIGARTEAQLADNLAAADLALTDDDLAALDDATQTRPTYPDWMVARQAADRTVGAVAISVLPSRQR